MKSRFDFGTHNDILIRILKDIYTNKSLGPLLGFKGGTAALLFYGLDRFSVDLDFDLLETKEEDFVFDKIEKIISRYGLIKSKMKKHYTLFFELSYADLDRNIKVEINRRNFGSACQIQNYFGITMLVITKEDMFANKLCAFYERADRANRDIYDVWFFLQNRWSIHKELVENRLGLAFEECIKSCISKLEKVSEKNILSGMGELMDPKQKRWVKANLKIETLFLLKVLLDQL